MLGILIMEKFQGTWSLFRRKVELRKLGGRIRNVRMKVEGIREIILGRQI
jgi:hypothetical protein